MYEHLINRDFTKEYNATPFSKTNLMDPNKYKKPRFFLSKIKKELKDLNCQNKKPFI